MRVTTALLVAAISLTIAAPAVAANPRLNLAARSASLDAKKTCDAFVTGSRIRRQDFTANAPITTVDETAFEDTGTIGVETRSFGTPVFGPMTLLKGTAR